MPLPPRWNFELRLITPAFIGGARPREVDPITPLRATSLRGLWRQWFRYGMSAVLAPRSPQDRSQLEALRKLETRLFGSTSQGSMVVVGPPAGGKARDFPPPDRRDKAGLRYLGYGIFDGQALPQCVETPGGQPVRLRVGLARSAPELEPVLAATLWLWSAFGGIGARSRRGWGAVELAGGVGLPWKGPRFGVRAPDLRGLLQGLNDGLDEVLAVYRRFAIAEGEQPGRKGEMPMKELRSVAGISAVRALPITFRDPLGALDTTGRLFQSFRSTLARNSRGERPHPDYFEMKDALQERPGAPSTVQRAAFGLPLPFYFRSLGGAKGIVVPADARTRFERLPSAFLLRPHLLATDRNGVSRTAVTMVDMAEAPGADHLAGCELQVNFGPRGRAPDGRIVTEFMRWAIAQAPGYQEQV